MVALLHDWRRDQHPSPCQARYPIKLPTLCSCTRQAPTRPADVVARPSDWTPRLPNNDNDNLSISVDWPLRLSTRWLSTLVNTCERATSLPCERAPEIDCRRSTSRHSKPPNSGSDKPTSSQWSYSCRRTSARTSGIFALLTSSCPCMCGEAHLHIPPADGLVVSLWWAC